MGILTRFKDIMSANINALLDKCEDPEKMIDQCLRNLNDDLGKVKAETAAVMAEDTRALRELNECDADIEKMQSYAVMAVGAGNDEDAKRFITEKNRLTEKKESLQKNYEIAHTNATNMRAMYDKLNSDIAELESRRDTVKSKLAAAKTQEKINAMKSSVNGANDSIASFKKYEDMAEAAIDKANAMAELNASAPENKIEDLMAKYNTSNSVAGGTSVDDELAALKASLGK